MKGKSGSKVAQEVVTVARCWRPEETKLNFSFILKAAKISKNYEAKSFAHVCQFLRCVYGYRERVSILGVKIIPEKIDYFILNKMLDKLNNGHTGRGF